VEQWLEVNWKHKLERSIVFRIHRHTAIDHPNARTVSLCLFGSGILGLAAVLRRKQALARRKSKL